MPRTNIYSKDTIEKAKKMRKEGYEYPAIAKYLGFSSVYTLTYHVDPKRKEQVKLATLKWISKNRERYLKRMREYNKEYNKRKKLGQSKVKN